MQEFCHFAPKIIYKWPKDNIGNDSSTPNTRAFWESIAGPAFNDDMPIATSNNRSHSRGNLLNN